jgi:hypothetical protein
MLVKSYVFCVSADFMVFSSNMVIVIGPTPPGTGVTLFTIFDTAS